jgi:hypothetical protein
MPQWTAEPDVSAFPAQPRWATWIKDRSPQFKLHNTLGMAKNALSSKYLPRGTTRRDAKNRVEWPLAGGYVYEWVVDDLGEGWVERFRVMPGDFKADHPLWKFTETPRPMRPVSQKAIDEALASIQMAVPTRAETVGYGPEFDHDRRGRHA